MKTFISFVFDALGFFFTPKRTIDELYAHYKPSLLPMGFTLSLIAVLSLSVSYGVSGGWFPATIFFSVMSAYLGQFLFVSIILALMALFNGTFNTKSFWGLFFASDIILLACLPLVLIDMLLPFSIGMLIALPGLWVAVIKLFVIQKTMRSNFAKAFVISLAPILLFILWIVGGAAVFAESLNGLVASFY